MTITAGVVSDWELSVAAFVDGATPTTFTRVFGITDFTPPGVSKNLEDDSDFDSGAWGSQTGTGLDYEISGSVKVARATATPDAGQEILRAAGKSVGEDGYVHFRTIKKDGTAGHKGLADATFTESGGSRTDLTKADFTLAGRGELLDYIPTP